MKNIIIFIIIAIFTSCVSNQKNNYQKNKLKVQPFASNLLKLNKILRLNDTEYHDIKIRLNTRIRYDQEQTIFFNKLIKDINKVITKNKEEDQPFFKAFKVEIEYLKQNIKAHEKYTRALKLNILAIDKQSDQQLINTIDKYIETFRQFIKTYQIFLQKVMPSYIKVYQAIADKQSIKAFNQRGETLKRVIKDQEKTIANFENLKQEIIKQKI